MVTTIEVYRYVVEYRLREIIVINCRSRHSPCHWWWKLKYGSGEFQYGAVNFKNKFITQLLWCWMKLMNHWRFDKQSISLLSCLLEQEQFRPSWLGIGTRPLSTFRSAIVRIVLYVQPCIWQGFIRKAYGKTRYIPRDVRTTSDPRREIFLEKGRCIGNRSPSSQ